MTDFTPSRGLKLKGQTTLYRHYSASGELLYVGISVNAMARLAEHKNSSHWFDQIRRVELTHFTSRSDAAIAEKLVIMKERPLHNILGQVEKKYTERLIKLLEKETGPKWPHVDYRHD